MKLLVHVAGRARRAALMWLLPLHGLAGAQAQTANEPTSAHDSAQAATRVVAGVGLARYASDEPTPDGRVFNHEQGELRRTALELRYAVGAWQLVAALRQAAGAIDYTGQTQLGLPLVTKTDLSRRELALTAEHSWQPEAGWPTFTLGAGVASLRTARGIRATPISSALTETLRSQHWTVHTGASAMTELADMPLRLSTSLQWHKPWRQTLTVDTHGLVDPFELRPTKRWGGRLGFSAALSVDARFDVGLDFGLEAYRPGDSAPQPVYRAGVAVGAAGYPGSVQSVRHGSVTLAWRL